ncbi:MAG: arylesterase [Gammaproteobacteria bacterium]|nr:arylesterase [Gammaproteobacteria bacterium]
MKTTGIYKAAGILIALALLSACADPVPPVARLAPDDVILAFGDSLTRGTGAEPEESYPAQLSQLIGRKVINAGQPGELSAEGLKRLPAVLDRHQPVLLILCHGGNDLLRRRSSERAAENLRQMIAEAQGRGIPVILIGVPAPGLWLSAAEHYAEIAEELGIPYQGEILPEILDENDLKSDMIHPNGTGYRMMAEAIAELLRQAGAV